MLFVNLLVTCAIFMTCCCIVGQIIIGIQRKRESKETQE